MSLKIWLPFTSNINNQGISNITPTVNNPTFIDGGKIGKCLETTQAINLKIPQSIYDVYTVTDTEISYALWFKIDKTFINNLISQTDFSTQNTLYNKIVGFGRNSTSSGVSIVLRTDDNLTSSTQLDSIYVYGHLRNGSASNGTTPVTIAFDQWYHAAVVYDKNNTLSFYLNGELIESKVIKRAKLNTTINSQNVYLNINCCPLLVADCATKHLVYLKEYFNDVRVYDHALSAAEVRKIAQGLVLHYKLDDLDLSNWNLLNNTKAFTRAELRTNAWARADAIEPGLLQLKPTTSAGYARYLTYMDYKDWNNKTYTLSFDAQEIEATNEAYNISSVPIVYVGFMSETRVMNSVVLSSSYDRYRRHDFVLAGEGWQHYSWTFSLPQILSAGQTSALVDGSQLIIEFGKALKTKPLQIKNIKLELGDQDTGWSPSQSDINMQTNTIIDSSGYGYHGSMLGTPTMFMPSPRYNTCIAFDGEEDAIKVNTRAFEIEKAQNFTLCAWVYSDRWGTSVNDYFISSQESGGFLIRTTDTNNIIFRVRAFTAADFSASAYIDASTSIATLGLNSTGWHFIAGVYSLDNLKIYVDGELCGTKTKTTYGLHFNNTTNLFLGGECANTVPTPLCKCAISDMRIYYTSLLDRDIKQLYNTGVKIDKQHNIYTGEFIEKNDSITKFKKTAIVQSTTFFENNNNQMQISKKQIMVPNPAAQEVAGEYGSVKATKHGVTIFGNVDKVDLTQYLNKRIKLAYNVATDGDYAAISDAQDTNFGLYIEARLRVEISTPGGLEVITQTIQGCTEGLAYNGPLTRITQYMTLFLENTQPSSNATFRMYSPKLRLVTNKRPSDTNNAIWSIFNITIEEVEETQSIEYEELPLYILSDNAVNYVNSLQLIEY